MEPPPSDSERDKNENNDYNKKAAGRRNNDDGGHGGVLPNSSRDSSPTTLKAAARNLFSSTFFGWYPDALADGDGGSSSSSSSSSPSRRSGESPTGEESTNGKKDQQQQPQQPANNNPRQRVLSAIVNEIERQVPADPSELRDTALFRNAYGAIQWQRDNYLVGTDYANWRKRERFRLSDKARDVRSFQDEIQFDETALGHQQFGPLAASFVPSETVRMALLPLVAGLPPTVLYGPAQRGLVGLVQGQQDNLDAILKNQLLMFLKNPNNRAAIKNSTQGYISTAYRD